MRCATDHEPCRQNLATLESSFGGVSEEKEDEGFFQRWKKKLLG